MLSLVLAVLAASPDSPAPKLPNRAAVFVVGATDTSAATAAGLEQKLSAALEAAQVDLVSLDREFPAPPADDTGRKLLADGKRAYDDLDYEVAIKKYQEAVRAFTEAPESADARALGEAHFFIGVLSVHTLGKAGAKRAQEAFAEAVVFDPDLELKADLYGAEAKKLFDKARQEVSGRPLVPLKIASTPVGAMVTLRGNDLGRTPLSEPPSVPAGRHLVRLAQLGFAPHGALVDVGPGSESVQIVLRPLPGYGEVRTAAAAIIPNGVGSGKVPSTAKRLAQAMKSRFLVVGVAEGSGGRAEVWDVETNSRLGELALGGDLDGVARQVKAFLDNPSPLSVAMVKEPPSAEPVYKKWWFWTAVGVVAVGGATTAGVVAASSSKPGFNVVLAGP